MCLHIRFDKWNGSDCIIDTFMDHVVFVILIRPCLDCKMIPCFVEKLFTGVQRLFSVKECEKHTFLVLSEFTLSILFFFTSHKPFQSVFVGFDFI